MKKINRLKKMTIEIVERKQMKKIFRSKQMIIEIDNRKTCKCNKSKKNEN